MSLLVFTLDAELLPRVEKTGYGMGQGLRLYGLKHASAFEISVPKCARAGRVCSREVIFQPKLTQKQRLRPYKSPFDKLN